ncbi:ammonia-forming cytochrome c nitrite reductase subunit c552 [Alkalicella caledoniensis]|uniref:nitrite reductase (cytochrome; ammonia-forming) n=1 Tax=Alkalicella caledoniensis TaxID=2731377 RepID=A0A7G9W556_ALKCA|nr:ammonia-forming cytochrome c nitrite reductase subunit c552 [Alkalicella caledoniensis]QNO13818.1 ammonia-forming cytochrome c nitrite reductase subunit c552 [Alkalicella caledoniensis]
MTKTQKIILSVFVVAMLGFAVFSMLGGEQFQREAQPSRILDPEYWADEHPLIYQSYLRNSNEGDVEFGGEQQIDYIEKYPQIRVLYEGYGFSKEYFSARGHVYALEDVINIGRPRPGASCLACKTADYDSLYEQYGSELFGMDFVEVAQEARYPITCYSCHRNEPGELHITVPHAEEGFQKLDFEVERGSQNCAQCHVEYYIDPETTAIVLPWENGLTVEDYEQTFNELDYADWIHPRTGTPLIKIQHPEYEMYRGSPHHNLGMDCNACHMPQMQSEDGEEYVSHWWTSPLKTAKESCLGCHGNHDEESIAQWVNGLQQEVEDKQKQAMDLLVELVESLAVRVEEGDIEDETLEIVRELHRRSQIRWDYIFAENSTGSHHFARAHAYLDEAIQLAQEALEVLENN